MWHFKKAFHKTQRAFNRCLNIHVEIYMKFYDIGAISEKLAVHELTNHI